MERQVRAYPVTTGRIATQLSGRLLRKFTLFLTAAHLVLVTCDYGSLGVVVAVDELEADLPEEGRPVVGQALGRPSLLQ